MIADALPVALDLADHDLSAEVAGHVESVLGWQVVRPGPHLPARLLLADRVDPAIPTVVVAWTADVALTRSALRAGALDVIAWPGDRERLADLTPGPEAGRPADRVIAVTAAAGGVGATTVALALGAREAWEGRSVVVLTDATGLGLAGRQAGGAVTGVRGLAVHPGRASLGGMRPSVLVADAGVGRRGQVLVGRPDRALAQSLHAQPSVRAVAVVGEGGLRSGEVRRLVGDRTCVALPWSFRVARAGVRGLVPVGLPGAWIARLAPLSAAVAA